MAENDAPEQGMNFNETEWGFLAAIDALEYLNFDTSMASVRDDAAEIATIIVRRAQRASPAAPDAAQKAAKGLEQLRIFIKQHRHAFISAHESEILALINNADDAVHQARRETWSRAIAIVVGVPTIINFDDASKVRTVDNFRDATVKALEDAAQKELP